MFDLSKFPFSNLVKLNLPFASWIFYKEFKVVNQDEFSPDFYTYILISNKGDIIYISTDEYKCNENLTNENYFIKRRIDTDDVTLSSIDFKHVDFTGDHKDSVLSKKSLITLVDNIVTQKIRNLLIN